MYNHFIFIIIKVYENWKNIQTTEFHYRIVKWTFLSERADRKRTV